MEAAPILIADSFAQPPGKRSLADHNRVDDALARLCRPPGCENDGCSAGWPLSRITAETDSLTVPDGLVCGLILVG